MRNGGSEFMAVIFYKVESARQSKKCLFPIEDHQNENTKFTAVS